VDLSSFKSSRTTILIPDGRYNKHYIPGCVYISLLQRFTYFTEKNIMTTCVRSFILSISFIRCFIQYKICRFFFKTGSHFLSLLNFFFPKSFTRISLPEIKNFEFSYLYKKIKLYWHFLLIKLTCSCCMHILWRLIVR
jgi:hypothetical protein